MEMTDQHEEMPFTWKDCSQLYFEPSCDEGDVTPFCDVTLRAISDTVLTLEY